MHVALAAAVFVAHAPVVENVCIVGRVCGASAHRMRSASAGGRVHLARPAVFVAPAPVASTLREGCSGLPCPWRQLQPHPQHQRQWQSTAPVRRPLPSRGRCGNILFYLLLGAAQTLRRHYRKLPLRQQRGADQVSSVERCGLGR